MRMGFLRFDGAVERDPAIAAWMKQHAGEMGAIAQRWFEAMQNCGKFAGFCTMAVRWHVWETHRSVMSMYLLHM